MPEPSPAALRVIAPALMVSAVMLLAVAMLIFTGVLPLAPDSRPLVSGAVAVAAVADLLVGVWFFRKSQSS